MQERSPNPKACFIKKASASFEADVSYYNLNCKNAYTLSGGENHGIDELQL